MAVIRRIGIPENDSELLREALMRMKGQGSMHDPDGAVEVISRMCTLRNSGAVQQPGGCAGRPGDRRRLRR
jgi:hypothetical protein